MLLTKTVDPHSHPRCINCAAMLGWSRQAVRTRFKLMVSSRHARSFPPNGHPPFKENRKLPDLHTSKMHLKKMHPVTFAADQPLPHQAPSCWSERSVISFHNCKVILQAFSCGVFSTFFSGKRCPKKHYKNPRILWSFLYGWISTNLVSQTKQQLLRHVLQLLKEISLGKMHSWRLL